MKIKFNHFERVAGLFVLTAILGSLAAMIGVAVKRGWFEPKVELETTFKTADGIYSGTMVQMAGLRAGSVDTVELEKNNEIHVRFKVSKKFHDRIRKDSIVRIVRPFVIGEKVLDVSVGSDDAEALAENATIPSEDSPDIMDLLNGRKLAPHLATLSRMSENLKFVAEAFLDPERVKSIVKIFDELSPLVSNMNGMSREVTSLIRKTNQKDRLTKTLDNLVTLTTELTAVLPQFTKNSPDLASDLTKIAKNTAVLTEEMQKFLPLMNQMAPELPRASARALEALDETVVTLKALQKSFLLRGNVEEVREEESKRVPASAPSQPNTTDKK